MEIFTKTKLSSNGCVEGMRRKTLFSVGGTERSYMRVLFYIQAPSDGKEKRCPRPFDRTERKERQMERDSHATVTESPYSTARTTYSVGFETLCYIPTL